MKKTIYVQMSLRVILSLLCVLLLIDQPAYAGTLDNFEEEATDEERPQGYRPARDDDDDESLLWAILRGIFRVFFLGHGDGLHRGDLSYRLLQSIFKNRLMQWLYARIHPNGSMAFAHWWSKKSRMKHRSIGAYMGEDKEHQVLYARKKTEERPDIEYLIFGHRHIPYDIRVSDTSRVICLGDWIGNFTYGVFDGNEFQLKKYLPEAGSIIKK